MSSEILKKKTLPETNKFKTTWDLSQLYKSQGDSRIEKDMREAELACGQFEKKYKKTDFSRSALTLVHALHNYENLLAKLSSTHSALYFHLIRELNASDSEAEAKLNIFLDRATKATNKILFFELTLGKISSPSQKKYLNDPKLKHFKYYLSNIFKRAKHDLSEPEEKILSLMYQPAKGMWKSGYQKILNKQTIFWHGKELPISEANSLISISSNADRVKLQKLVMEKIYQTSDFAEAEINAIYTEKKISDELRGFKKPFDATLISHETEENMVNALIKAVTGTFSVSHHFYKVKAKLLGLKRMGYQDRGASVGSSKSKISFKDTVKIVSNSFQKIDPYFSDLFLNFLNRGQIDVYPKKGKHTGAYCLSEINTPTFILLDYTDQIRAVSTVAHEMGHAIHSELSKTQSPIYQGYSTAVAEVASTFFEQVLFDELFRTLTRKEQIILLHDKINRDVSSVFRQIACFNFENDLHKEIRSKGFVPKEKMATLMNHHMKKYLGPLFNLNEMDGYFFAYWSHIRSFFYVYSYAYGALISKALFERYKVDKSCIKEIKTFLGAGGSKSPHDIFKSIGINTSTPKFWKEGIESIEKDVKELEKLVARY